MSTSVSPNVANLTTGTDVKLRLQSDNASVQSWIVSDQATTSFVKAISLPFEPLFKSTIVVEHDGNVHDRVFLSDQGGSLSIPLDAGPLLTDVTLQMDFVVSAQDANDDFEMLQQLSLFDFIDTVEIVLDGKLSFGRLTWDYMLQYFDSRLTAAQKQSILNMTNLGNICDKYDIVANAEKVATNSDALTNADDIRMRGCLPLPFAWFNNIAQAFPTAAVASAVQHSMSLIYQLRQPASVPASLRVEAVSALVTYVCVSERELARITGQPIEMSIERLVPGQTVVIPIPSGDSLDRATCDITLPAVPLVKEIVWHRRIPSLPAVEIILPSTTTNESAIRYVPAELTIGSFTHHSSTDEPSTFLWALRGHYQGWDADAFYHAGRLAKDDTGSVQYTTAGINATRGAQTARERSGRISLALAPTNTTTITGAVSVPDLTKEMHLKITAPSVLPAVNSELVVYCVQHTKIRFMHGAVDILE
jgi:hypothetical protein